MAKQANIGSGVVAAAREVSAIQGRFQDFGGQFMKGYEKSMEAKRKKEAEAKDILDRSNAYMNQFKNDIDVVKFKPEDQKIVKDTIARWRNEYADAASAAAKIQDKTSPEYQEYIDIMNGVQNRMYNLKTNIDNLALHKAEHYSNVKDDLYSNTGTNQSSLLQAQIMVESPIGKIDDNGDLLWGEGDNQFSFQGFEKPLERASTQVTALGGLMAKAGRMKGLITEGDRISIEGQIDDIFKGNRAIESIMADNEFKTLSFNDLDPSNPEDRKEAIRRLKNGIIGNWGKGLPPSEQPGADSDRRSRYKMPETVEQMIKVQEDARLEGPKIGSMESADIVNTEAKIFSLGPSDNPEQIRVKMDPSTKKWIYYNAKIGAKAEYNNLLDLMNSHPKVFYNS